MRYDVIVRIEIPGEPDTHLEAAFRGCPRESLLDKPIINSVLKVFEESLAGQAERGQ